MSTEQGLKNYFVYGFGQIINLIAPLLVAPKIIAVCGMENWGKIGVAISIFTIINIFIDFGSVLVGVKEVSVHKSNKSRIRAYLNETYQLRFYIFGVIAIIYFPVVVLAGYDLLLYSLGFVFVFAQVFNPIWYYQGMENYGSINRIIFVSKIAYIVSIYIFVRDKNDYVYMIFLLGLANTLIYGYFLFRLGRKLELSFTAPFSRVRDNFKNEYPIVISSLSIAVYANAPILLISTLVGNYETGIYKIGDMLLNVFRSYLSVFFTVSFPRFCSISAVTKEEARKFLKKINLVNIVFVLLSGILLFALTLICIDYVDFDRKTTDTILYCSKFLFIPVLIAFNIPYYQMLIFNNEQKLLSKISFAVAVAMCICCYGLTSLYQLNGSVVSLYVVEFLSTISIIIFYKSRQKNLRKKGDVPI
jgi:O-antigen/teichoic acid export membrane protein